MAANRLFAQAITLFVLVLTLAQHTLAALTVALPLASQLPQLAHTGQPFSWAFADTTFVGAAPGATVAYIAEGLPPWAAFDAETRMFSGTPANTDVARTRVTVRAVEQGGEASAALDTFNLLVVSEPAPVLRLPLTDQLATASTLGVNNILPGNKLHLPLGWSFSVGFDGNTFTVPDGSVYTSAMLAGGKPLPSWMTYDVDTFTLYGLAPTQPGPEGESFEFVMTGSNRPGYSGTTASLTIVVSQHALTVGAGLRPINITAGDSFKYKVPTTGLQLDGRQSPASNTIKTTADVSGQDWLSFDVASGTLSGTVPFDIATTGQLAEPNRVVVPLTFADTHKNILPAEIVVQVYASPFTQATLPNIFVSPGVMFNSSLTPLLREPASTRLNATYDPPTASAWLSLDNKTHLFAGRPPMKEEADRVKVYLTASGYGNLTSTSSFFIALKGDKPPDGENGIGTGDKKQGGMSSRGQIALIASLGAVGGLVGLIILMIFCRRCCAVEEHDTQGVVIDNSIDEERTLHDEKSPRFKTKELLGTPSTVVASPYLDPKYANSKAWGKAQDGDLKSILVAGGKRSPAMDATYDAYRRADEAAQAEAVRSASPDRPRQMGIMRNLLPKKKRAGVANSSSKSLAREAQLNSAFATSPGSGLGLNLGGGPGDDPYNQQTTGVSHSRSRYSGASVESWERDLHYTPEEMADRRAQAGTPDSDGGSFKSTQSSSKSNEPPEVPRRRGAGGPRKQPVAGALRAANGSGMTHRNSYANQSPAIVATGQFAAFNARSEGHTSSGHGDHFEEAEAGFDTDEPQFAEINQVRRVRIEEAPRGRDVSSTVEAGVYDDAEDEETLDGGHYDSPVRALNRDSVMSHIPTEAHLTYPDNDDALGRRASILDHLPETTMRIVAPPSSPPPTPGPYVLDAPFQASAQASGSRPVSRGGAIKALTVDLTEGRHMNFKLLPKDPPQLRGAPDSPGKRSGGRRSNYRLVLDQDQIDGGSWPSYMSEWVYFDERTFEVSGRPPPELVGLFPLTIVMVLATSRPPASPALGTVAPPSPGKRPSNARTHSNGADVEEDIEIVARVTLRCDAKTKRRSEISLERGYPHAI